MQEGSYERVRKKVRTSACARRFVRASVRDGAEGGWVGRTWPSAGGAARAGVNSDADAVEEGPDEAAGATFESSWLQS